MLASPNLSRKAPSLNFWIRRFWKSATYTPPAEASARPGAPMNCPSPVPDVPHFALKAPLGANRCTRLLPLSAT